jgi:hypothetical protein
MIMPASAASTGPRRDQSPSPRSEDAFLGTAAPRAGRLSKLGRGDQPKLKPPGCGPGASRALIIAVPSAGREGAVTPGEIR